MPSALIVNVAGVFSASKRMRTAQDEDGDVIKDVWSSSGFAFTLPTVAGRSYLLRLVFHDNYFATGGYRRFSVNAGLMSGGAQPWVQHLDLAAQGACGTNALDVVLTLPVPNSDGTGFWRWKSWPNSQIRCCAR